MLCVDDEPHVLRALQWLLQKEFEIHTAASAQEAMALVEKQDFDVVVSDQRMPGVSGVELLREVRRRAPRAMRILLTGYSDLDAMVRSVNESEVFRFITKPWDIRELPKLIADAAQIARSSAPVAPAEDAGQLPGACPGTPAQQQVTTVAMHARENVMVLDDSHEVHEAVAQAVGNTVQVQHAYSLADAVRILNEKSIGVMVSEVRVGKLDATRLVRLMKEKRPETVTVVLSGQSDAATVVALINQGQVYRFLPKPLKPGFIRLVLEMALKRHRQLSAAPSARARFGVEQAPREASESLLRDVQQAAAPRAQPAAAARVAGPGRADEPAIAAQATLAARLTSGFRRLFG